jgi:deoxyribonuclease-4
MHPGSHVKNTLEDGIDFIVDGIQYALDSYDGETKICLETMSGKGTEIGRSLDEIKMILEKLEWRKEIGICLDSCHLFASGYDFRNKNEVDRLVDELNDKIGLDRVFLTHLNDSKESFDSNKDRHENIGQGQLGIEGIRNYLENKFISTLPILLETPVKDEHDYLEEIKMLREMF